MSKCESDGGWENRIIGYCKTAQAPLTLFHLGRLLRRVRQTDKLFDLIVELALQTANLVKHLVVER